MKKIAPILSREFFARPTLTVAKELLGKVLVYQPSEHVRYSTRIVETEAYLDDDPASHSFRGKTERNAPMFGPPGFTYIYFIYGMYHCLNFVTEKEGKAGAVLIRAVEPVEGIEGLTNGPGKLCRALGLTKVQNGVDLCQVMNPTPIGQAHRPAPTHHPKIYLMNGPKLPASQIVISKRIGIREEHQQDWRFYIKGNPFVSKLA